MVRVKARYNERMRHVSEILDLDKRAVDDATESCDVLFRQNEKHQFSTEGDSGGEKWADLNEEYAKRKARLFAGARAFNRKIAKARGSRVKPGSLGAQNKILQLTGDMKRSFSERSPNHVAETVKRGRSWVLRLGAVGPKFWEYHELGAPGLKRRSVLQHKRAQWLGYVSAVRRRLVPHVGRRVRALDVIRRVRG